LNRPQRISLFKLYGDCRCARSGRMRSRSRDMPEQDLNEMLTSIRLSRWMGHDGAAEPGERKKFQRPDDSHVTALGSVDSLNPPTRWERPPRSSIGRQDLGLQGALLETIVSAEDEGASIRVPEAAVIDSATAYLPPTISIAPTAAPTEPAEGSGNYQRFRQAAAVEGYAAGRARCCRGLIGAMTSAFLRLPRDIGARTCSKNTWQADHWQSCSDQPAKAW